MPKRKWIKTVVIVSPLHTKSGHFSHSYSKGSLKLQINELQEEEASLLFFGDLNTQGRKAKTTNCYL